MITLEEIKELSGLHVGERAFLSMYASGPAAVDELTRQYKRLSKAFQNNQGDKHERMYFEENVQYVRDYFAKHPRQNHKDTLAVFVCTPLDYLKVISLHKKAKNLLWVDASPYIRPLLEDHADYENIAIVVADNHKARVFLVTAQKALSEDIIRGNVKNRVRKGGWSQKRYERRRDKQLFHYAKEIVGVLRKIHQDTRISRLMLFGSKETTKAIAEFIPEKYENLVYQIPMNINRPDGVLKNEIIPYYRNAREDSVKELFEEIKIECLRNGLGTYGIENVLEAVKQSRVDIVIFDRELKIGGYRCKKCEDIWLKGKRQCPQCNSEDVFEVDMINESSERLQQANSKVYFTDQIPLLKQVGGVVAQLRYRINN